MQTIQSYNAKPGEERIPGSQSSEDPQSSSLTDGLAVAPGAEQSAPAANETGMDAALAIYVNRLVESCHGASKNAGWWTHQKTGLDLIAVINNPQDALQELLAGALVAQKLCLSHSEISESMEGHRKNLPDDKLPHRPMIEVELADAVIRICDLAGALGLDIGGAIAEKMAFNKVRPDHKPENRLAAGGKAY